MVITLGREVFDKTISTVCKPNALSIGEIVVVPRNSLGNLDANIHRGDREKIIRANLTAIQERADNGMLEPGEYELTIEGYVYLICCRFYDLIRKES